MRFVLVMFLKCAACSVVCEIRGCCGVREERLLRREGGVCVCERADRYGKRKLGVLSIQVDLQITSRVLADLFIQAYQRQESSTL